MGDGYVRRHTYEHLMKRIYFVTEGPTDQIVLNGLVENWLGEEDFVARHIQPPSSAYAEDLDSNLSGGWRGVVAWCQGRRPAGPAGRDEAIALADCLFIHVDADVATDPSFANPPFTGSYSPASNATNWVRRHLTNWLGGELPLNVVLCVPSQDLEAWVLCALHPEIADEYMPIECREEPAALLVQRAPYRLVRRKDGRLRKDIAAYEKSLRQIIVRWSNVTGGNVPRCPEALRFEQETIATLAI